MKINKDMLEYTKGFTFPKVTIEEWIKLHNFKVDALACSCGESILNPEIPIESDDSFGILYSQCFCKEKPPVVLLDKDLKEREETMQFIKIIKDHLMSGETTTEFEQTFFKNIKKILA